MGTGRAKMERGLSVGPMEQRIRAQEQEALDPSGAAKKGAVGERVERLGMCGVGVGAGKWLVDGEEARLGMAKEQVGARSSDELALGLQKLEG